MFQIFMIIGWAVLLVILLYIWADIREMKGAVKDNKRELLRNSFGGRTSGSYQGFQEDTYRKPEGQRKNAPEGGKKEEAVRGSALNESEEQVLKEVLTEFLG